MGIIVDFWTPWGQLAFLPPTVSEYAVLSVFALVSIVLLVDRRSDFARLTWRRAGLLAVLLCAPFVATNLLAPRYALTGLLPPPGIPFQPSRPLAPLLGALPAAIAGAWLGPGPAMFVGLATGISRALVVPSTILELFYFVIHAFLVGSFLRQDYRGRLFALLRQPLVALPLAAVLATPVQLIAGFTRVWTTGLAGVDYAASLVAVSTGPLLLQSAVAGVALQIVYVLAPRVRPTRVGRSVPPHARSLFRRQMVLYLPVIAAMVSLLVLVATRTSLRVASESAVDGMMRDAQSAAAQVPLFLQTGQSLLTSFAEPGLFAEDLPDLAEVRLEHSLRSIAFFEQLALFDQQLRPIALYPSPPDGDPVLTPQERVLVQRAMDAGASQMSTVHRSGTGAPIMSFVAPVPGTRGDGTIGSLGTLVGRARMDVNPVLEQTLAALRWTHDRGEAFIVDSENHIVVHPDPDLLLADWHVVEGFPEADGETGGRAYEGRSSRDGSRQIVYQLPVEGHPWSVVVVLPYDVVLEMATEVGTPLLALLLSLGGGLVILALVTTRSLSRPLRQLAQDADRIAGGDLTRPVDVRGADEVDAVAQALERLRVRLKGRLDDLSLLLEISQAVSATVDVQEGLSFILEGALRTTQAQVARVVVLSVDGEVELTVGRGEVRHGVRALDRALVQGMGERSDPLVIEDVAGLPDLDAGLGPLQGRIRSAVAVPVRSAGELSAVIWVGHREARTIEPSDIDVLNTLAAQTAVLVENARLFQVAQSDRRKLAAILASTTDGVVVIDQHDRVVLCNPAAEEGLGVTAGAVIGERADDANLPAAVTRLLTERLLPGQTLSTEATGEDGRTMSCNVSVIVSATGERLGRVATIRDTSVLKGLERSKAQFIARVSRDLRRPLTLIRGYATMLPMVGELNERQREFVASIVQGVEQTGEMVEGLLNLGELGVGGGADRAPVRLAPLVIDAVEGAREQAAEGGVFLRVGTVERSTGVTGDAALLRQAVAVLLDNAIADTAPGGAVRVELMVAHATATIRVEDGGTGGDAVGEPAASLGLATVRSIVDQHGGELRVETEPGAGSTYIISLPTSQMKASSVQGTMA